jgi:hypothetical protein
MGEIDVHTKFCSESLTERDHSEYLVIDVKVILEWIIGRQGRRCELDASGVG